MIGSQGEQLGVLTIEQALAKAQEEGLDLVEVSPMTKPPVCKILDYGKFKYLEKKKQNEAKKKQVVVLLKEVKFRPRTEEHDYDTKLKKIREFLAEANKAKITVMFRGREMSHRELGSKVLERIMADIKDVAVIESVPRMEGRLLFMIVAPNPKLLQAQRSRAQAAEMAAAKAEAGAAAAASAPAATAPEAPEAPEAPAPAPAAVEPAPVDAPAPAPEEPPKGGAGSAQ